MRAQQPSRTSPANFISGGTGPICPSLAASHVGEHPSLATPQPSTGSPPRGTTGPPVSPFPCPARAPAQTLAVPVIPAVFAISLLPITQLRPVPAGRPFSSLGGWHAGSWRSAANLPAFCFLYSQSDHSAFYFPFQLLHKYPPPPPRLLPFPREVLLGSFLLSPRLQLLGSHPRGTGPRASSLYPEHGGLWPSPDGCQPPRDPRGFPPNAPGRLLPPRASDPLAALLGAL